MTYTGINYDFGTEYIPGVLTRQQISADEVQRDMQMIKDELHCNSVRIYGTVAESLLLAAGVAAEAGLNVWLSPRLINRPTTEALPYLQKLASQLQELQGRFARLTFVLIVACEVSIDQSDFVGGVTIHDRIKNLLRPRFFITKALGLTPPFQKALNQFLVEAVRICRREFTGLLTYASAVWKVVDWTLFDLVSMNLYKASYTKWYFAKNLRKLKAIGKPVAITEFGCCTYAGAEKKGASGYNVLDTSVIPPFYKKRVQRDETVQAQHVLDCLKTFSQENIDGVFVFDFYTPNLPYNSDTDFDLDKASFAVTKPVYNKPIPKKAFHIIAGYYRAESKKGNVQDDNKSKN